MRAWFPVFVAAFFAGCVTAQTGAVKAQETAQELNLNTRFGRMELAMEHVAATQREEFIRRHKSWGGSVRIADAELAGMRLIEKDRANVIVRVAWYRVDEQELRLTTLKQVYRDHKGDWQLESEERADGDLGLLGEVIVPVTTQAPRENVQFPTIRLAD